MWKFSDRVSLHVGHYQKPETYKTVPPTPTTIRLEKANLGGALRFRVVVEGADSRDYHILGLSFSRADLSEPVGTRFTTGKASPGTKGKPDNDNTPFGNVKINEEDNIVEFEPVSVFQLKSGQHQDRTGHDLKEGILGSHRTYRFMIFIQQVATGKIGVIDPENEIPNSGSSG